MSDQIICVRIAQRALDAPRRGEYSIFPFDRVYLGKKEQYLTFKKLFRYYMCLPLDAALFQALGRLKVSRNRATPVIRDDAAFNGTVASHKRNYFLDHITDIDDWLVVVPTHVRTVYRKPEEFKDPHKSELGYVLSRAIQYQHNRSVKLPQITLVTPTRTVPILCGVCKRILEMHAGNCIPGQPSCKFHVKIQIKYDDHNCITPQQSVEESGDY